MAEPIVYLILDAEDAAEMCEGSWIGAKLNRAWDHGSASEFPGSSLTRHAAMLAKQRNRPYAILAVSVVEVQAEIGGGE